MKPLSPAQRDALIRWSNGGTERTASNGARAFYEYKILSVAEAVERTTRGDWQLPEFQRAFVWNAEQVCDVADSLLRGYPLGVVLLWAGCPGRSIESSGRLLIADGQQRLVSLCLMFGLKPAWWSDKSSADWPTALEGCDLRFDIEATRPPFFRIARAGETSEPRMVSVARCLAGSGALAGDEAELLELAREIKTAGACPRLEAAQIRERLMRVRAIAQRPLATAVVVAEPDDLVEIFERLTGGGLRFRRILARAVLQSLPLRRRWLESLLSLGATSGRQAMARDKSQVRNL